jgi:hypothetical protein
MPRDGCNGRVRWRRPQHAAHVTCLIPRVPSVTGLARFRVLTRNIRV